MHSATLSHTDDATPDPRRVAFGSRSATCGSDTTADSGRRPFSALGDELSTDSLGPRQLPRLSPIEGGAADADAESRAAIDVRPAGGAQRCAHRDDADRARVRDHAPAQLRRRRPDRADAADGAGAREPARPAIRRRRATSGCPAESQRAAQAPANSDVVDNLTNAATSLTGLLTRCSQNPLRGGVQSDSREGDRRGRGRAPSHATFAGARRGGLRNHRADGRRRAAHGQRAGEVDREPARRALGAAGDVHPGHGARHTADRHDGVLVRRPAGPRGHAGAVAERARWRPGLDRHDASASASATSSCARACCCSSDVAARLAAAAAALQYRLGLGGIVRFATSRPDSATNLIDIGTGEGAGVEVRSALDMSVGRVGATIAARYATYFERTVNVAARGISDRGLPVPAVRRSVAHRGRRARDRRHAALLRQRMARLRGTLRLRAHRRADVQRGGTVAVLRVLGPAQLDTADADGPCSASASACASRRWIRSCAGERDIRSKCRTVTSRRSRVTRARRSCSAIRSSCGSTTASDG